MLDKKYKTIKPEDVKLTEFTQTAGCAAKIGPGKLAKVLSHLEKVNDDNLVVGLDTSDDCAVYKVRDDLCLIQSLDFFTPVVNDPYTFGQVAAANSLSDLYAMGSDPLLALNIVCFSDCMNQDILVEILKGGADKAKEAGCLLVGGHTIQDDEPKYGLSVTGINHPDKVWANSTAKVGDVVVLTKKLGVGIVNTALKGGMDNQKLFDEVIKSMSTLNKYAKEACDGLEVHAATDVTGFGLCGHALEMAKGSDLTIEIDSQNLPIFEGVEEFVNLGLVPKGAYDNRNFIRNDVKISKNVSSFVDDLVFDPQTSGGLLIALCKEDADKLVEKLHESGQVGSIIGRVKEKTDHFIEVI